MEISLQSINGISGVAGGLGGGLGVGANSLTTALRLQGAAGVATRFGVNAAGSGLISAGAAISNNVVGNLQDIACVPWDHRLLRGVGGSALLGAAFGGGASLGGDVLESAARLRPQFYTLDGALGSPQPVVRNDLSRNLENLYSRYTTPIYSLDGALGRPQSVLRRASDAARRGGDAPDNLLSATVQSLALPFSSIVSNSSGLVSVDGLPPERWRGDVINSNVG
jgi:hypothetical protein